MNRAHEIVIKITDKYYEATLTDHVLKEYFIPELTRAIESYGRECRLQALDDAAAVIELYMRLDKYASQPEQRGLLVNATAIIRALKETKEKS